MNNIIETIMQFFTFIGNVIGSFFKYLQGAFHHTEPMSSEDFE